MAAYAATVTAVMPNPIQLGNACWIWTCKVDITNYNQTLAAISGIVGRFRGTIYDVKAGVTDTGYILEWKPASNSFKAWTFEDTGNVPVQVASDVDVGEALVTIFGAT